MSRVSSARASASGSPMRCSLAQSTATRTRSVASAGASRRRSPRGMKPYSRGSGAPAARYITTSLPRPRRASVVARSDPSASPSGFSCVTTRKRSCSLSASAIAWRSLVCVMAVVRRELVDELAHSHAALDRGIVLERELRGPLHSQLARETRLEQSVRRVESRQGRLALAAGAENADVDGRMPQIGRRIDARHRDEPDARVLELGNGFGENLPNRFVHAPHALTHASYSSGSVCRRERRRPRPTQGGVASLRPRRRRYPTMRDGNAPQLHRLRTSSVTVSRLRSRAAQRIVANLILRIDEEAVDERDLPLLPAKPTLGLVEQPLRLAMLTRDARRRDPRPLPHVVMVDLCDRRAHAALELRLCGPEKRPFLLQRVRLREVEFAGKDPDPAARHDRAGLGGRSFVERRPLDLARLEDLEDVAFLHVVETVEANAALEALRNLADVFLEALQIRDRRRVDHGPVADDADVRVPAHDTVGDHAAGDRLLDLLGELVDDVVRPDLDAFARRKLARLGVRTDVEADNEGITRGGEHDVVLGDRADARLDDVEAHLRVLELRQLRDDRLDGADHVAAHDEVEIGNLARLQRVVEALEGDASARTHRSELLAPETLAAAVRDLPCLAVVPDHARELSRRRRLVEAEDLDRVARQRALAPFALVVEERLHAAVRVTGDDRVANLERAALHEHRGDRAAADVEARFDDRAGCLGFGIRAQSLELEIRDEEDLLEERVEVRLRLGGDFRELDVATPVFGVETLLRELALDAVDVRVGEIDLVYRDDDRNPGGAGVRDRLLRLWHDAVVGRDDENSDVGHLRAAGAHRGERFVARRVEERDLAAVDIDLVRADVLRDAAGLGRDDAGVADCVEERRLAVVYVTHDRDNRRPRLKGVLGVVERLRLLFLVGGVSDRDLALDLRRDQLDLLVAQRRGLGLDDVQPHQKLHDLGHLDAERLRKLLDRDARFDGDRAGRRSDRRLRRARRSRIGARLPLFACVRPLRALVDDDATAPPCWATAAARAKRTIRFASVSHLLLQCKDAAVRGRFGHFV